MVAPKSRCSCFAAEMCRGDPPRSASVAQIAAVSSTDFALTLRWYFKRGELGVRFVVPNFGSKRA